MKYSGIIVLALIVLTLIASIPIMQSVAKNMSEIPLATPINIPTALKKSTKPDQSFASVSASHVPTKKTVQLYFVSLEDNGKAGKQIGCNDSLVPVDASIAAELTTKNIVEELLSVKTSQYFKTGLYNALYRSKLNVEKTVANEKGFESIYLVGKIGLGGVCDTPRVIEQLYETARQGNSNKKIKIYINNEPLEQALSQK